MIRLHFLGAIEITASGESGGPAAVARRPGLIALLARLALQGRPFTRRDLLHAAFWPDHDADQARHALNQAIYALRSRLGSTVVVSRGALDVGLDPETVWCDAAAFLAAVRGERLGEAMELYRGDLLPGFFADAHPRFEAWLEETRADLRRLAAAAARKRAFELEDDAPLVAATCARRAAELTGDELTLQACIGLLDRLGDRAAALSVYQDFRRRVWSELGVEPSPETSRLVRTVRARSTPHDDPGPTAEPRFGEGPPPPS